MPGDDGPRVPPPAQRQATAKILAEQERERRRTQRPLPKPPRSVSPPTHDYLQSGATFEEVGWFDESPGPLAVTLTGKGLWLITFDFRISFQPAGPIGSDDGTTYRYDVWPEIYPTAPSAPSPTTTRSVEHLYPYGSSEIDVVDSVTTWAFNGTDGNQAVGALRTYYVDTASQPVGRLTAALIVPT